MMEKLIVFLAIVSTGFAKWTPSGLWIDETFQCPPIPPPETSDGAISICPAVCVADPINDCPPELRCPNGDTLCWDGTCASGSESCSNYDESLDPCAGTCNFPCALLANDTTSGCANRFGNFSIDLCGSSGEDKVPWNGTAFVLVYIWTILISLTVFFWCYYNNKMNPVGKPLPIIIGSIVEAEGNHSDHSSPKPGADGKELDTIVVKDITPLLTTPEVKGDVPVLARRDSFVMSGLLAGSMPTQTGYKYSRCADIIYVLVLITAVGFQILLGVLTGAWYNNENDFNGFRPIRSSSQALAIFEVVWMVAWFWILTLKWPQNGIRSLFLRRTTLAEAEIVVIFTPLRQELVSKDADLAAQTQFFEKLFKRFNHFFNFIFSETSHGDGPGQYTFCPVVKKDDHHILSFHLRSYAYEDERSGFLPSVCSVGTKLTDFHACSGGLTTSVAEKRLATIGYNTLGITEPNLVSVIIEEFAKPFYTYQIFMAWTWLNFGYWHMGIINIFVFSSGGIAIVQSTYENQKTLFSLSKTDLNRQVFRDGKFVNMSEKNMVPGDIFKVEQGPMSVDAVLLQGNVVMDESSLTGESMPVAKGPLPSHEGVAYSQSTHKSSSCFAGTEVKPGSLSKGANDSPLGLVLATGASTTKGEQVRSILFGSKPQFKFDVHVQVVVLMLAITAVICFSIVIGFLKEDVISSWFYGMYVIATVLPPLLPTVFVVAVGFASDRLKKTGTKGVVCSDPNRILMAGKVRVCAFDKTGTLTKQGESAMEFHGITYVVNGDGTIKFNPRTSTISESVLVTHAMASAHSLSEITVNGKPEFIGNAVDLQMFQTVGWTLSMGDKKTPDRVSSKDGGDSLEVVFRFIFDHHRMTMSCIVKDKQGTYRIFCKGSAESVKAVCDSKSLPADFDRVQLGYSREGCYTLAFGSRLLTDEELAIVQRDGELDRNAIESNLSFIGLLTFKNELKPDTTVALRRLRQGAIRTLMVSGDHILTAISIAQQCEMIAKGQKVYWARSVKDGGDIDWMDANDNDKPVLLPASDEALANIELAVTGSVFEVLSKSNLLPTWIYRIRVYARMTPGQKIAVVEAYKQLGLIVAFCGDGGNDCGALRAAHVGLALSDAEASVVSPFTGLDLSVMGMVDVMLEGRAGLASAFASYKYMLMYGLVETANQMVNAYFSVTFSSWCWIFMDGFWVIVMAFTIPLARPTQDLSDRRPPSSLLGYQVVSSMLGVLLLNILFMVVGVQVMRAADFYQCRTWEMAGSIGIADQDVIGDNYESSVLFMVTGAQYFTSALAFSYGGEHREPVYKNAWFMFFFLLFAVIHLVTLLTESKLSCLFRVNCEEENIVLESFLSLDTAPINNPWNSTVMPVDFRIKLLIIILVNTLCTSFFEKFGMIGPIGAWCRAKFPKEKHVRL